MTVPARTEWPTWLRFTLTAVVAFASAIVTVTVFLRDVERSAAQAYEGFRLLAPRVESLERDRAANAVRFDEIQRSLLRIEAKVDRMVPR